MTTIPRGLLSIPRRQDCMWFLGQQVRLQSLTVKNARLLPAGQLPHALGMDAVHHRLFIGSRVKPGHLYKPGKMVVMDADNGKIVQVLDSEGGVDEVEYDPASQRVYFTGTTGSVEVFKQVDPDHYESLGTVPTGAIAKTSLLVSELKRFYAIVPKHIILTPPIPESKEATIEDATVFVY